ncbi:hypothetical protein NDU88_006735 [Pleurodeles waltl]|uniref:Uncharacterized protein n=1 Tax=Pleurodeles waltl TaxID=8319 RepID=A0AAV7RQZ2_PLEWA|nr:hypothetical protein NDU88_006735 [Pleurodeles waltl]
MPQTGVTAAVLASRYLCKKIKRVGRKVLWAGSSPEHVTDLFSLSDMMVPVIGPAQTVLHGGPVLACRSAALVRKRVGRRGRSVLDESAGYTELDEEPLDHEEEQEVEKGRWSLGWFSTIRRVEETGGNQQADIILEWLRFCGLVPGADARKTALLQELWKLGI